MLSKPFVGDFPISQHFGENLNPTYKKSGLKGHTGIDFAMPTGIQVISPCDGVVVAVSVDITKGEGVAVISDSIFKYNGQDCKFDCIHWHMKDQSIKVKVGDHVTTGQLLGLSNNTGNSTGPHLHFSIIPIATDGSRRPLAPNNGFNNCIDPLPYLDLDTPLQARIRLLQAFLNQNGAHVVVDGKFGPISKEALSQFLEIKL